MRIAHLSDLHFGADDADVAAMLAACLAEVRPDLTVISGDFTQTGRRREFKRAEEFLQALPSRYLCVPGNHDVPARDLLRRFADPFGRYSKAIGAVQPPVFENELAIVAGINSARRALPHWNWANGAVSAAQRRYLDDVFSKADAALWRIAVLHHPVHADAAMPMKVTVFGRKRTLRQLRSLEVDLVLTGHTHAGGVTTIGDEAHQTLYLSASTAISTRRRGGRKNGFNVIDVSPDRLLIRGMEVADGAFSAAMTYEHRRLGGHAAGGPS